MEKTVGQPELGRVTVIVDRGVLNHEIGCRGLETVIGGVHALVIAIEDVERLHEQAQFPALGALQ